ncbi:hypothetical protein DAETH_04640 [Deinococcus aetherius]|uniref:Uncharacterized protein n=1 Tax=Deinococcus aetherius TaxID=200252 RepID=A0ABM8A9Y1_9DEIO|nr:hypothetical protein [Deinococcus aetherius]BDP40495.1 hypothetical protein DAETH_04640 [Deinococcus aetherius]
MKGLMVGLVVGALGGGFVAGRLTAPTSSHVHAGAGVTLRPLPVQAQLPNDPREVIPLVPGPGDEPGQGQPRPGQGPQQPGQGQGQEQCVLLFKDGQMYRLQPGQPQPGQGQQPGQPQPGGDGRNGQPGGDNELFPLEPFDTPPSLPGPSQPGEPALPDLNRRI